jgi:hypothetical protein
MSSGPHDANAIGNLAEDVYQAACKLADKIKAARNGHRGHAIPAHVIVKEVNDALSETGFVVKWTMPSRD